MRGGQVDSWNLTELSLRRIRSVLRHGVLLFVVALAPIVLSGCGGLVSSASTGNPPPPSTLDITNVQAASATTSTSQVVWTTNVPADSAVDYGTSTSYGSSTPVDSAMVTSHQVTLSGLAASTTYYYQVRSSDSKNNHGNSGGHTFKTSGFSIAGAISPATGGSGATLTLSGAASTTTTADSLGNYTFMGLANGTYTVAPSHAGFTFTPSSQSTTVSGANVTGVNFTDSAAPVAPSITTQPTSQTVTAGQTASFTVAATGTAPLSYQWQKSGANIAGATTASYTTPVTTTGDSGATFAVVVTNTAGTVTSSAATLTVNPATLVSIAVTPANPSIIKGATQQFTATGTFSDSSTQVLSNAVWASATPGVATINATGLATAVGAGSSTISATVGGITGSTLLTVTPATLVSIAVTPANPSITKGATQQFTATGTFSDSSMQVLTNAVWASATPGVATINATGLATGVGAGTSTISATVGSISGSTLLTVTPATLVSIAVTPANPSITKGATQQFTATGTFSDNSTQVLSNAVWASATPGVATINATGLATGVGAGSSTISATVGSITGSTLLTVTPATLVSIAVTPANPSITKGATQQFTATGTFSDNSTQVLSNAVWASATPAVATINATGLATTVGTGTSTISATVGSITGSTLLTVNPAPAPAIQVNPTSISFVNAVVSVSSSQALIIINTGTATLTITQVTASGSATFSVSGFSLPLSVNAGKQTTITVTFLPTSVGSASGNLSIVSNAPTSPTSVGLSGTAIAATLTLGISPPSLSFGNVTTSTSSAPQNVTITNTGNANVTISQVSASAGYSVTGGSTPVMLSPAQNLILTAQFSPTSTGPISGNISIVSNATGSPASVPLSGTGVPPIQHSVVLTWNASTSAVAGYNVYRGTVSGGPYTKINSALVTALTYTDSTVQNGTTYYYVTTAVDSGGTESVHSNEVSAPIP
jgi:hypothetical protein